jgi:DNA-binding beta-propeller fold protein YncE
MRFAGQNARSLSQLIFPAALLAAFAAVSGPAPLQAQQVPFVLPYTMSTFAGAHAPYTAGAACGNYVALDIQGDGCLAPNVSVGTDPHDVRVDPRGNLYYLDNAAAGLIHKININTLQETIFVGSPTQSHACAAAADTFGDGCPANDGAANNNPANYTTSNKFKAQRGLGVAPNGDVYSAGYNDAEIHKVSLATGMLTIAAGTGTAATVATTGPVSSTQLGTVRGVTADASGNVYIADTGENVIQEVTGGQVVLLTAANNGAVKTVSATPALATSVQVSGPEDVQLDTNGNIYIVDAGNNVVQAIWMGKGTLPGVTSYQMGYLYLIAGNGSTTTVAPYYSAGTGSIATAVPATSIPLNGIRKMSIDKYNNLYIADTTDGIIWFVDAATGYMRVIAGNAANIGLTPTATSTYSAVGCPADPTVAGTLNLGDGCPGDDASLYGTSTTSIGNAVDNLGNLYITDPEGGVSTASRIRKLLSGLVFPAAATGVSTVQNLDIHFGAADTGLTYTVTTGDFVKGTASCTVNADTTTDCILPIAFKPTIAGYDSAVLTITAAKGGVATYTLSGVGNSSVISIDPGYATSATSTSLATPAEVAVDPQGNTYVADTGHNRILKITNGTTTVFAGNGTSGYTGDNASAALATLNAPSGVAFGISGSIYISDTGNNVIRRVNLATGIITTVAGGGAVCSTSFDTRGDGCPALNATLSAPRGIVIDKIGQLYIADSGNNVIREVGTEVSSTSNYIYTLAGGGTVCSAPADTQGDGCAATATTFNAPAGIAYDQTGNYIVVADTGDSIVRKIYLANSIATTGAAGVATAIVNPATLVAGYGQAGSTVDANSVAINSQLNLPAGVAVDAAENIYIADTGNAAVRLVSNGLIATIAGALGTPGATPLPGSAPDIELTNPAGVAVLPNGNLFIADTGNSRLISDARNADSYNFGRLTPATTSNPQNFTILSVGNLPETLTSPAISASTGNTADFGLVAATTNGCAGGEALTLGATCVLTGTFSPAAAATYSATYTIANSATITLIGTGAYLTPTTSTVTQTAPATGNAQYGGSLTLTVNVTPSTCNAAAPSCAPTGTARITLTNPSGVATQYPAITLGPNTASSGSETFSGLAVGAYTVTCSYSGDGFYSSSSCGQTQLIVAPATTTSTLAVSPTTTPQFGTTVLTATIKSSTIGIPTGTVTFTISPAVTLYGATAPSSTLGTANINAATGVATLTLQQVLNASGLITSDNTVPPGVYTLSCTYNGATNYAISTCNNVTYTVTVDAAGITIVTRGCSVSSTAPTVTGTPNQAQACQPSHGSSNSLNETLINGIVAVTTAQGSVTDAALFITPTDSVGGQLTFSCSGLPQYSTCTFSPSSITLPAGTAFVNPIPVDVTLWTDLQPLAANHVPTLGAKPTNGIELVTILGWPMALLGLLGLTLGRKRFRHVRFLAILPLAMLLLGSSLLDSGCAGPGDYKPNLTPAGQYPITITVSGPNGLTKTTQVYFVVTAPGIPAIE